MIIALGLPTVMRIAYAYGEGVLSLIETEESKDDLTVPLGELDVGGLELIKLGDIVLESLDNTVMAAKVHVVVAAANCEYDQ